MKSDRSPRQAPETPWKALRLACKMTQEKFAHEIGITVSSVNRWEEGHAYPSELGLRAMQAFAAGRRLPFHVPPRS